MRLIEIVLVVLCAMAGSRVRMLVSLYESPFTPSESVRCLLFISQVRSTRSALDMYLSDGRIEESNHFLPFDPTSIKSESHAYLITMSATIEATRYREARAHQSFAILPIVFITFSSEAILKDLQLSRSEILDAHILSLSSQRLALWPSSPLRIHLQPPFKDILYP